MIGIYQEFSLNIIKTSSKLKWNNFLTTSEVLFCPVLSHCSCLRPGWPTFRTPDVSDCLLARTKCCSNCSPKHLECRRFTIAGLSWAVCSLNWSTQITFRPPLVLFSYILWWMKWFWKTKNLCYIFWMTSYECLDNMLQFEQKSHMAFGLSMRTGIILVHWCLP